jgi:hypothetical protein
VFQSKKGDSLLAEPIANACAQELEEMTEDSGEFTTTLRKHVRNLQPFVHGSLRDDALKDTLDVVAKKFRAFFMNVFRAKLKQDVDVDAKLSVVASTQLLISELELLFPEDLFYHESTLEVSQALCLLKGEKNIKIVKAATSALMNCEAEQLWKKEDHDSLLDALKPLMDMNNPEEIENECQLCANVLLADAEIEVSNAAEANDIDKIDSSGFMEKFGYESFKCLVFLSRNSDIVKRRDEMRAVLNLVEGTQKMSRFPDIKATLGDTNAQEVVDAISALQRVAHAAASLKNPGIKIASGLAVALEKSKCYIQHIAGARNAAAQKALDTSNATLKPMAFAGKEGVEWSAGLSATAPFDKIKNHFDATGEVFKQASRTELEDAIHNVDTAQENYMAVVSEYGLPSAQALLDESESLKRRGRITLSCFTILGAIIDNNKTDPEALSKLVRGEIKKVRSFEIDEVKEFPKALIALCTKVIAKRPKY